MAAAARIWTVRERIAAGMAAVAVHLALAPLLARVAVPLAVIPEPVAIALFNPAPPPSPPPIAEPRAPEPAARPEGASAPPGRAATASAIVALPAVIAVPPPPLVVVAPIAGSGAAPSAGAADTGTGTGATGVGSGTGSGRGGTGIGGGGTGGGGGVRARLLRGTIGDRDYPAKARKEGAMGTVTVAFIVDARGRPGGCAVTITSGHAALDTATCALISARFRYAPARDATGAAVAEVRGWRQRWWFAAKE